jgi:predicted PurR-regulated permease PerM
MEAAAMLASSYPFLDVMWSIFIFFAWVIWIWFLIVILSDVFRRHDIGGGTKALWVIFVIFVPFVAALIYLIRQGSHMAERNVQQAQAAQAQADDYIRSVAAQNDPSEQIRKGKELLDSGAITQDEYAALKARALAAS